MIEHQLATALHHLRQAVTLKGAERTDGQLLHAFTTHNDQAAFAQLVRRHGKIVMGVCKRVLRREQDAEDAFQATFLVLAKKADTVRKSESLAGWLHGVAYRTAMRAKRDDGRRQKHEGRVKAAEAASADWEVAWREVQVVLDEEVERLPEVYRDAFVLCCLERLSQAEAARRLGVKEGTVSSRLTRARKRLQEALSRRGISLSAVLTGLSLAGGASASVSRALADATCKTGTRGVDGTVEGLSAKVLTLAEGAMQTMLATKMKLTMLLLLTLSLLGAGVTVFCLGGATAREPAAPPAPLLANKSSHRPPAPQPEPPKPEKPEAELRTITGSVLDPQDKPVQGAKVFVWANGKKTQEMKTGAAGQFRMQMASGQIKGAKLVATADGFGPAWLDLWGELKQPVTLRLPADDVPITGRILDLEGKPVQGATVQVQSLRKPAEKDLTSWIEAMSSGRYPDLPRLAAEAVGMATTLTTDKEGRFRLSAVGRERVVNLLVKGEGIQQTQFSVVTRSQLPQGVKGGNYGVYAARFDHLVSPSRAIVGTVRDKKTGKVIVGITVASVYHGHITVKTDEKGRYRIEGAGKHSKYGVAAGGKMPYFNCTQLDIPDRPGLEPLIVDFEMEAGVVLRGKVTDKLSGKPVQGRISYRAFSENPNLQDYTDINKPQILVGTLSGDIAADGTFEVLAIPGKGILGVVASPRNRYSQNLPADIDSGKLGGLIPEQFHTMVPINVDPADTKSLHWDLTVEPGRILAGKVVDGDGKPLSGTYTAGLSPVLGYFGQRLEPLDKAEFQVGGLGKHPRQLVFVHSKQKRARVLTIKNDEKAPLTVRLDPLGAISGRIVAGKLPRPGVKVVAVLTREYALYGKEMPLEMLLGYQAWNKVLQVETKADQEGRFTLEGLVPGLKYQIEGGNDGQPIGKDTNAVTVESGKTKNLGDLNIIPNLPRKSDE